MAGWLNQYLLSVLYLVLISIPFSGDLPGLYGTLVQFSLYSGRDRHGYDIGVVGLVVGNTFIVAAAINYLAKVRTTAHKYGVSSVLTANSFSDKPATDSKMLRLLLNYYRRLHYTNPANGALLTLLKQYKKKKCA
jgi:hypothetical protein